MKASEAKGLAVAAGVIAGAIAYEKASTPPPCAGVDGQTLLDAISGAESHPLEDFVLGLLGAADLDVEAQSAGLITPEWASSFYSWYHGLSDEQKAAVKSSAESGAEACAALETAGQVSAGTSALLVGLVVGVAAFVGLPLLLEVK